jgi:uncharacterized membrane protein YeaQ/YmgE (transglycosylase-associated protein family)
MEASDCFEVRDSREWGGALRKREVPMGLVSRGILGIIGELFPIIFLLKLGMAFVSVFGIIIGAVIVL